MENVILWKEDWRNWVKEVKRSTREMKITHQLCIMLCAITTFKLSSCFWNLGQVKLLNCVSNLILLGTSNEMILCFKRY